MQLQNLAISRIVFHEVYRRRDDRRPQPPAYGVSLAQLAPDAMDELRDRIVTATGSQSQSMEMTIAKFGADSALALANDLMLAPDDATFLKAGGNRVALLNTSIGLCQVDYSALVSSTGAGL